MTVCMSGSSEVGALTAPASMALTRAGGEPSAASMTASLWVISELRNNSLGKMHFRVANHTLDRKFRPWVPHVERCGGYMLAEMFMLRLEAIAPTLVGILIPPFGQFVPLNPAAPIEFKIKSRSRRSWN